MRWDNRLVNRKAIYLERCYSKAVLSTGIWAWPEQGLNPTSVTHYLCGLGHFTSLSFSDLLGKMGIIIPTYPVSRYVVT